VEVGDLSSWEIEPDRAVADLFSLLLLLCIDAGTAAYYFLGAEKKAAPKRSGPLAGLN
jgi:hypothetical protein